MAARSGAPTLVRNTTRGPLVFRSEESKTSVEWQGADDPMGGDVQPVPASFLDDVQFHRMAARGILVIQKADEVGREKLDLHRQEWEQRQERQRTASADSLDTTVQDDAVVKTCIGPSGKGPDQLCGADVPIRASKLRETPPLCSMHGGLANQFLAQESDRLVQGKPEVVWRRVAVTATERQS